MTIATISDKPYRTIARSRRWVAIDLKEFWRFHELLYLLTLRDVKLRYKQTALGVIWAVLQPLLTMVIFTVLFGRVAKIPSDGVPYALFAYCGLLPWTFFANGITNSSNALVNNANLISKVYFSRLVMPTASVLAGLIDLGISFLLLLVLFTIIGSPYVECFGLAGVGVIGHASGSFDGALLFGTERQVSRYSACAAFRGPTRDVHHSHHLSDQHGSASIGAGW